MNSLSQLSTGAINVPNRQYVGNLEKEKREKHHVNNICAIDQLLC